MTEISTSESERQTHLRGLVFVLVSAFAFSLAGILTKAIQSDMWIVASWRGFVGGLLIVGYVYWQAKRKSETPPFKLGWRGWVGHYQNGFIHMLLGMRGRKIVSTAICPARKSPTMARPHP